MEDKIRTALIGAEAYIEEIRKALFGHLGSGDTIEAIKALKNELKGACASVDFYMTELSKAEQERDALSAKVKEIEGVLWYIKVENSYCVVCLEDHPEYEDDMTDNDYLKTCKPDCKLAAVLTQDTQQEKPECELREGEHGPFRHNGGWWVGEYGHAAQPGVMTPTREIQDTQPDTDHRKNHPACRECEYRDRCVESPAPSVGGRVEKKTDCCWYWDNHPDHPDTQPESTKEKLAKDVEAEWQKWLDDIQQVSPPESFLDSIASLCQSILGREITVENTTDTQPPKPCSAPLMSDYLAIKDAAISLLEACEHQDNCENLCEKIDGDLLDNLRVAIGKKYIVKPSGECPECGVSGQVSQKVWLSGGMSHYERLVDCPKCKPDQEV